MGAPLTEVEMVKRNSDCPKKIRRTPTVSKKEPDWRTGLADLKGPHSEGAMEDKPRLSL